MNALERWRTETLSLGGYTPIVDVIANNNNLAFSGFGRHLANDFLYFSSIFPDAPAVWVCQDDLTYERFKQRLLDYTSIWRSQKFIRRCGMLPNSSNPFAFNTTSNHNYITGYIWVFRKRYVQMKGTLNNEYLKLGLFDEQHTIGECIYFITPWSCSHLHIRPTIRV